MHADDALTLIRQGLAALETAAAPEGGRGGAGRAGSTDLAAVADALGAYLSLAPGLEEDDLLKSLLSCAMDVVQASAASVALYDEGRGKLVFRAAVGATADRIVGLAVSLENTQMGIAFRTGQPIAAAPLDHSVDKIVGENKSVLVAPLLVHGQAIGTLSAVNKKTAPDFTPADIMAFMRFADIAAHILAQRDRESSLRNCLTGKCGLLPKALAGEAEDIIREGVDDRVFHLARILSALARQEPETLETVERMIRLLAQGL